MFVHAGLIYCLIFAISNANVELKHNVSLKWSEKSNVLSLECYIQDMGLGVFFYDPKGRNRGHCNPPLLSRNVTGHCDTGMEQQILTDHQVENILNVELIKCENGRWKCIHGQGRHEEDTTDVTMDLYVNQCPEKEISLWLRCCCVSPPLFIGYLVLQFLCITYFKFCAGTINVITKCLEKFPQKENKEETCCTYAIKFAIGFVLIIGLVPSLASIKKDICTDTIASVLMALGGAGVAIFQQICGYFLVWRFGNRKNKYTKDRSDGSSEKLSESHL